MEPETTPTNLVDMLDQLIRPEEPVPVSMRPETWGWAALAVLLILLLGWGIWVWRRRHRANAYRREAEQAIERAGGDPAEIALILRQTALAAYPRTEVAALSGEDWLAFLDATSETTLFSKGVGRCVAGAPYRPSEPVPDLAPIAIQWVRTHQPHRSPRRRRHMAWPGEVS